MNTPVDRLVRLRFAAWALLVFVAGGNTTNNLSGLIPVNPQFQCSWWKVAASVLLASVFAVRAWVEASKAK